MGLLEGNALLKKLNCLTEEGATDILVDDLADFITVDDDVEGTGVGEFELRSVKTGDGAMTIRAFMLISSSVKN